LWIEKHIWQADSHKQGVRLPLFLTVQLSNFLANKFDAVGLKAAIIFLICAFVVYCVAALSVDHLINISIILTQAGGGIYFSKLGEDKREEDK
jgi:hypothetical protein